MIYNDDEQSEAMEIYDSLRDRRVRDKLKNIGINPGDMSEVLHSTLFGNVDDKLEQLKREDLNWHEGVFNATVDRRPVKTRTGEPYHRTRDYRPFRAGAESLHWDKRAADRASNGRGRSVGGQREG